MTSPWPSASSTTGSLKGEGAGQRYELEREQRWLWGAGVVQAEPRRWPSRPSRWPPERCPPSDVASRRTECERLADEARCGRSGVLWNVKRDTFKMTRGAGGQRTRRAAPSGRRRLLDGVPARALYRVTGEQHSELERLVAELDEGLDEGLQ